MTEIFQINKLVDDVTQKLCCGTNPLLGADRNLMECGNISILVNAKLSCRLTELLIIRLGRKYLTTDDRTDFLIV